MNGFSGEDFKEECLEWVANKQETYYSSVVSDEETKTLTSL